MIWRAETSSKFAMRLLRRLRALTSDERRLLVSAACWLSVVQLGLGRLPFPRLRRLVTGGGRQVVRVACDLAVAERVVWAVTVASRYVPGRTTCLSLALTVQGVLARRGHPSRLHIGVVRGAEGQVDAHAWIECGGRVLIGGSGAEVRRFTPLAVFDVEATFKLLAVESGQGS